MNKLIKLSCLFVSCLLVTPTTIKANDFDILQQARNSERVKNPETCPMESDEALVCEIVMCNPVGLAIAESRSECLQKNRKFAIYLAKLGFWDKPPKCKMRDKNCNEVGQASNASIDVEYCDELGSLEEKNICRSRLDYPLITPPSINPMPPNRPPIIEDPCAGYRNSQEPCNRKIL